MELVQGLPDLGGETRPVVIAMGNFDGVHLGHQAIINRAVERAGVRGGLSLALTFEPHPVRVLRPGTPLALLTPFPLKVRLLEQSGVEQVVCAKFTREFAEQSPADFVQKVLVDRLRVAEVCVGENFSFGKNREGRPAHLKSLGEAMGFAVSVLPPVVLDGRVVSSSSIRRMIEQGDVAGAARLLGRPYVMLGEVITGRGRGEQLGFPTANLRPADQLLPADGVYAGWVTLSADRGSRRRVGSDRSAADTVYEGAINVGIRPTFHETERVMEVHLLDYPGSGALYGQALEVAFVARIREERAFGSAAELKAQIAKDVEAVHSELAARGRARRGGRRAGL
ncbi:MAG TPA: bifunctional riboflavin kinase/FAD synthetase [Nitrospiria bacterium]|nr:bifunctional riboflavin kinase/FAD synthetase [Nitrospiria bacterium]